MEKQADPMSEGTKIQWADDTHNFWSGCTKVSAGCTNCYAEARDRRHLIEDVDHWGKGAPRLRSKSFDAPRRWNRKPWVCDDCGFVAAEEKQEHNLNGSRWHRRRVFSLSLGDWLDEEVPVEWLADMLRVIHDCPNLDFLLLTKRPGNWRKRLEETLRLKAPKDEVVVGTRGPWWLMVAAWLGLEGIQQEPPPNVWLGVSVENQATADERVPQLLALPAAVRFLSVEPLLGPVKLIQPQMNTDSHGCPPGLDWVIVGGESGPGARACNVEWIRSVVRQCRAAGVACFVKQLGKNVSGQVGECVSGTSEGNAPTDSLTHSLTYRLRDPKGGDAAEWPEDLRVREFPQKTLNHG